jgi:hypothetical protein
MSQTITPEEPKAATCTGNPETCVAQRHSIQCYTDPPHAITAEERARRAEQARYMFDLEPPINPDYQDIKDIHEALGFALREIDRVKQEALAQGWHQGYESGFGDHARFTSTDTFPVPTPNPHQDAAA